MPAVDNIKIHWRAPLQTKGFLRIIQFFLSILTFSLVAGYAFQGHVRCDEDEVEKEPITLNFKYPYSTYSVVNGTVAGTPMTTRNLMYGKASSAAQLFVAWGVLSMLYSVVALAVYMLFTANEQLEKVVDMLVYTDLAFNIAWVLCWFIACVEWTVAFRGMNSYIKATILPDFERPVPADCRGNGSTSDIVVTSLDTYEQAAIGSVFGFLSLGVWAASIYWVLIDTALFIKWRAKKQGPAYNNI